jgi:hypothetical protein
MDRIVSESAQAIGNSRRDRVVDEKPQDAALMGNSRSRTLSAA